ncbi:MAG: hypothetical protein ABGZ23_09405 [Fuerstiella sp.]
MSQDVPLLAASDKMLLFSLIDCRQIPPITSVRDPDEGLNCVTFVPTA